MIFRNTAVQGTETDTHIYIYNNRTHPLPPRDTPPIPTPGADGGQTAERRQNDRRTKIKGR